MIKKRYYRKRKRPFARHNGRFILSNAEHRWIDNVLKRYRERVKVDKEAEANN